MATDAEWALGYARQADADFQTWQTLPMSRIATSSNSSKWHAKNFAKRI